MTVTTYKDRQTVVSAGTAGGSGLWIVLKGSLQSGNEGFDIFQCIGDRYIQSRNPVTFQNNIVSVGESDIGYISRQEFEACIGGEVTSVAQQNEALNAISHVVLFRSLSTVKLKAIASHLTVQSYAAGDFVIREGEPGDTLYIVKSGGVEIVKEGRSLRTIETFGYFGERSVLNHEVRSASGVATCPTECWIMSTETFHAVIDRNIVEILRQRM
jgi:hypothetical protein